MKKSVEILLAFVLSGVIAGCGQKKSLPADDGPVKVKVAKAGIFRGFSKHYYGIVEESVSIPLSFMVSGTVEAVFVSEGQPVKQGELLATLDSQSYRNLLDIADAKKGQAEDAYRRFSALYQKGSLPEVKFIEVQTGLTQARAVSEVARENLANCSLFAPADGIIGRRSVDPGENVVPYQTALTLVDIEKVAVKFAVSENEIAGISVGDHAAVSFAALEDTLFSGNILLKGVVAQPVAHTYDVKIQLINQKHLLLPGMVCRVDIGDKEELPLAMVPFRVIQTDTQGNRYILKPDASGKKVILQQVTTGSMEGLEVILQKGLAPGEEYISEGYQHLDTTMNIQILR